MQLSRTIAAMVGLAATLGLAHAQSTGQADSRSWQKPAAAAAAAGAPPASDAPQATAPPATVPPTPVPAVRPVVPAVATTAAAPPDVAPDKPAPPAGAVTAAPAPDGAAPATDPKAAKGGKTAKKPPPVPAKDLFGAMKTSAPLAARSIGWYAKGCLAGAKPLAIDGPAWQVMRLSRNRNWGHPELIALLERFAGEVKKYDNWPGLLFGDIAQPRGGPMTSGHASHQVGLDADVWLTPMPDRRLTEKEREDLSATSMLAADDISVDPKVWGPGQVKIIKRAASYPQVERVLVHPAIKKALCEAAGSDRGWLAKVRPYWGHYYHFHIRIGCPKGSTGCTAQPPPPGDDGCGTELTHWIKLITPDKKKPAEPKVAEKPDKPAPKKSPITLADLPADCRSVLAAGEPKQPAPVAATKAVKEAPAAKASATKAAEQK